MKCLRLLSVCVAVCATCLVIAGAAQAAYNVSEYKLTPALTQAAGHPKLHYDVLANAAGADTSGGDDIKSFQVDLPAGLLINPNGPTVRCAAASTFLADGCAAGSVVGSASISWRDTGTGLTVTGSGTAYLLDSVPAGGNATIGLVLRPTGWKKQFLTVAASGLGLVRTGADAAYGMTLKTDAIPRTAKTSGGATRNITVSALNVDLHPKSGSTQSGPYFVVNPSRCSAAAARGTVVTYASVSTVKTTGFTPTSCSSVLFNPAASVTATNLTAGQPTGLNATFTAPTADAAIQNSNASGVTVDLATGMTLNSSLTALLGVCSAASLAADSCAANSRIGGATANVPYLSSAMTGDVYVTAASASSLQAAVVLRAGGQRIVQSIAAAPNGSTVRITASTLPQIAWANVAVSITSGVFVNSSACGAANATITLSAYSGASATRVGSLGTFVCPPPDTTITNAPPSPTTNVQPSFSFSSPYPGATFQCQLDTAAWAACASPTTVGPLAQATHTFCVRAIDASGNADPTPACYTFTVGGPPPMPVVSITSGPADGSTITTATATFTYVSSLPVTQPTPCSDPNVPCVQVIADVTPFFCSVDGGSYVSCKSPNGIAPASYTTGVLTNASHSFCVYALDQYGTASSVVCRTFTVNATVPFSPSFNQTLTNPQSGQTSDLDLTAGAAADNDSIKTLRVTEPYQLEPNWPAYGVTADQCPSSALPTPTATFDPTNCPNQSKIGTMSLTTPAGSISGTVYLVDKAPLPWLGVAFSGPVPGSGSSSSLRLNGIASNPQVDPTCDPALAPDYFCQTQMSVVFTNLPNVQGAQYQLNVNTAGRTDANGLPMPSGFFHVATAPCAPAAAVKSVFSSWRNVSATVLDPDAINGCNSVPDTQPPSIVITSPANGSTTTSPTATLAYTATDDSGAAPTCTPASGSTVNLVAGANTVTVNCHDAAGNPASASVVVNCTPFNPTFNETSTNPVAGQPTNLNWSFGTPPGNSPVKRIFIRVPFEIGPNLPAYGAAVDLCPSNAVPEATMVFDPSSCPPQARVGTMTVTTSTGTLTGSMWFVNKAPWFVPWIAVDFGSAKLVMTTGTTFVSPTCSSSAGTCPDPNGDGTHHGYCDLDTEFCQQQMTFSMVNIPASMDGQFQMTFDETPRTSSTGASLPGRLFLNSAQPCSTPSPVRADLTSQAAQTATVFDPDTISGCS